MPASKVGLQLRSGQYSTARLDKKYSYFKDMPEEFFLHNVPRPPADLVELAAGKRNRTKPEIKVQATLFGLLWEGVHADAIEWESAEREPLPDDEIDRIEAMHGCDIDSYISYPSLNTKEWKGCGGISLAAHFAGVSSEAARKWFRELFEPLANYLNSTDNQVYVEETHHMIRRCYWMEKAKARKY